MKADEVVSSVASLAFAPCYGPEMCAGDNPCDPCCARLARHLVADILATVRGALALPADERRE